MNEVVIKSVPIRVARWIHESQPPLANQSLWSSQPLSEVRGSSGLAHSDPGEKHGLDSHDSPSLASGPHAGLSFDYSEKERRRERRSRRQ